MICSSKLEAEIKITENSEIPGNLKSETHRNEKLSKAGNLKPQTLMHEMLSKAGHIINDTAQSWKAEIKISHKK